MSRHQWFYRLVDLGACRSAVEWAKTQPSAKAAWAACVRGDWMLWLLDSVLEDCDLLDRTWDDCSAFFRASIDQKARKQCADIIRKRYPKPPSLTRRKKQ